MMVSKCANPECGNTFLYFHKGKLFRIETSAPGTYEISDDNGMKKPVRHLEFFWLCDDCAGKMTIAFARGTGVSVCPKFARSASAG
jgi:hypothetical protein